LLVRAAVTAVFFLFNTAFPLSAAVAAPLCTIQVVDKENGWPAPLVELRTTHGVRFVSDNAGLIAFDLPELMGVKTWFYVDGHGYTVPADGFGYRGVQLTPQRGATLTVKVTRVLPAKRLGRLTGGGIFGESQKLGLQPGWRESGVLGCDSVQTAVHNNRMFWAWGDTTMPHYPLGLFHMTGATTTLKPLASLRPPLKLQFQYFTGKENTPRSIGQMPGTGPTWISGCISLPDKTGKNRLVATYVKIKPPLTTYQNGLCVWNEEKQQFEKLKVLWDRTEHPDVKKPPLFPDGHAVLVTGEDGEKQVLFGDPFPRLRCAATFEAWSDPAKWQALKPQQTVAARDSGKQITPHRGSIAWNAYRKKWVTVFTQLYGKPSLLGEIWYAEADKPTGLWDSAVKVVTHNNYTFYNPRLHPEFTDEGSPVLLFEATYTAEFASKPPRTPRYNYNQVLYRLDLNDPALIRSNKSR